VTITGGSYSDNGGDGIDLDIVGAVIVSGVTGTGNDPGIDINGAPTVDISTSNFSNNDNGGIYVHNITTSVRLTGNTVNENDADQDGNGDGFFGEDIGGPIVILGGTYSDPDTGNGDDQNQGITVRTSPNAQVYVGNDGTTVSAVEANGNLDDGIDIRDIESVSLDTVEANDNGDQGFDIRNVSGGSFYAVLLTDLTLEGNGALGGSVDNSDSLIYVTNKVATGSVADTLDIGTTTIDRQDQQIIEYTDVNDLIVETGLGDDIININGTGQNDAFNAWGGEGDDTITIAASNLSATGSTVVVVILAMTPSSRTRRVA
jgi:hypothetical protein